ncbi:MAG: carboxypeptidase-like regulatory domain-containing protein [Bacteroidales bacterium]|nr:carboxypeptidase-like regulatory domain-containing protein [Bacteroidales bacterium]
MTDSETGETLIGATVSYAEGAGALTDVDGHYSIEVPEGKQTLTVRYVGYRPEVRELTIGRDPLVLDVSLTPDNAVLQDVVVLGEKRQETEQAVVREQQQSLVTMTGVSEQFIKRTQDKDASEVIRRIPGVSIIDEKFVLVRGLRPPNLII